MENAKFCIELNATDPNDDPLVYTIIRQDKGLFVVDPGTGILQPRKPWILKVLKTITVIYMS